MDTKWVPGPGRVAIRMRDSRSGYARWYLKPSEGDAIFTFFVIPPHLLPPFPVSEHRG